jgi:hypothetical protein
MGVPSSTHRANWRTNAAVGLAAYVGSPGIDSRQNRHREYVTRGLRGRDRPTSRPTPAGGDAGSSPKGDEVRVACRFRLDPDSFTVFAMLRNAYPNRSVSIRNYRAAYVYQDPADFDAALARMVQAALIDEATELLTLSDQGRMLIAQVGAVTAQAADELWGTEPLPILPLAERCLVAAANSAAPGGAFHLVAPRYDEPDDTDATRLAERLTGLRWHRFDAHVAAWTSAGLTAAEVMDLVHGQERDEIEAGTNEQAAQPYAVLTLDERRTLIEGLQGLA